MLAELADPSKRGGRTMAGRLWRSRELIFTLVKRDLKIRYKSSALGFLWSFGRPLFLMIVLAAVFSLIPGIRSAHPILPYPLHLLAGILPWFFFAGALTDSLFSVLGNENVVKKVWLPTEVFPATSVIGQLIHFLLSLLVLALFIVAYAIFGEVPEGAPGAGEALGRYMLPDLWILMLPFLIALQTLLIFGLSLILSSLNVFYRDVSSIAEILVTGWFYLTPIIYPVNLIREILRVRGQGELYFFYMLNPMTPIIVAWRRCLFGHMMEPAPEVEESTILLGLAVATLSTLIILFIGIKIFRRASQRFADEL